MDSWGCTLSSSFLPGGTASRAMCRGKSVPLDALGVEIVRADLRDRPAAMAACQDMDVVFHVGGVAGMGDLWRRYYEVNVLGTRHVVEGCLTYGVRRLVFTSSPSVTFDGRNQEGIDESAPYPRRMALPLCPFEGPGRAARAGRQRAGWTADLRLAAAFDLGSPRSPPGSGPVGAGGQGAAATDRRWAEPDRHGVRGKRGGGPSVGSRRLAARLARAGPAVFHQSRRAGELLGVDRRAAGPGRPAPGAKGRCSWQVAWIAGAACEAVYRLLRLRGEPPLTRFLAAGLATSHYFNIGRARRNFGYEPKVSMAEGMRRLAAAGL